MHSFSRNLSDLFNLDLRVQPFHIFHDKETGLFPECGCRGNGAGKVLFGRLCTGLRDLGAKYMTLFTGETNPARNIYEAQGFKIVRTWADMHKQAK